MLSQVTERRNVALADFYRRPPSKRRHNPDEDQEPPNKMSKADKQPGIDDMVSWADNSSLPSLGMVRSSLLAEECTIAWHQLVGSVRSYFKRCLQRQSSGQAAGAQLFPNADRLRQLLADVVLPISKPLAPIEIWASCPLPKEHFDIFNPATKDGLRPRQEMGFIFAVRGGFLEKGDEDSSEIVDWCLFDAIFTPFADQMGPRLGRMVSSSLTYPTGPLLSVLAVWLRSLSLHQGKRLASHPLLKKIIEMIEDDYCFCMPHKIDQVEAMPKLSADFAGVFMTGYIEQRSFLPHYLWSPSPSSPIPLPALSFLKAFTSWLKTSPLLALQCPPEGFRQPSIYSARWSGSSNTHEQFPPIPLLGLASWCITCPLAELCCKESKLPLLSKKMPNPFDFSTDNTESASFEETLALRQNAALDWQKSSDCLAELHSQLLLALSLYQAQAGLTGDGANTMPKSIHLPVEFFLELAKELSSAASWLTKQGCVFNETIQLAGDRLGQIMQVAMSAHLLVASSDVLKEISSCIPSNRLLEVISVTHQQTS